MARLPLLLVLCLPVVAAAQPAPSDPRIDLSASGDGGGGSGSDGEGPVSVSGKIVLPPGWKLSIHVLTIRYAEGGSSTTLNALLPVKGTDFNLQLNLKSGSYRVWAVIDVKDAAGRERQISSEPKEVQVK